MIQRARDAGVLVVRWSLYYYLLRLLVHPATTIYIYRVAGAVRLTTTISPTFACLPGGSHLILLPWPRSVFDVRYPRRELNILLAAVGLFSLLYKPCSSGPKKGLKGAFSALAK